MENLTGRHPLERYAAQTEIKSPDECWLWRNGNAHAYPQFKIKGRKKRVSRWLAEGLGWDLSGGRIVLHNCDNPRCVNPGHLRTGTRRENARDAVARGRQRSAPVLTDEHAQDIRKMFAAGITTLQLARLYSVSRRHIYFIINNKRRRRDS